MAVGQCFVAVDNGGMVHKAQPVEESLAPHRDVRAFPLALTVAAGCLASLATGACGLSPAGPSASVAGSWSARSIGHFEFVELALQQTGGRVFGVACSHSDGVLLFQNAIVTGERPDVEFVVTAEATRPCCGQIAGRAFHGTLDETGNILGLYGTVYLRFTRSSSGRCESATR